MTGDRYALSSAAWNVETSRSTMRSRPCVSRGRAISGERSWFPEATLRLGCGRVPAASSRLSHEEALMGENPSTRCPHYSGKIPDLVARIASSYLGFGRPCHCSSPGKSHFCPVASRRREDNNALELAEQTKVGAGGQPAASASKVERLQSLAVPRKADISEQTAHKGISGYAQGCKAAAEALTSGLDGKVRGRPEAALS